MKDIFDHSCISVAKASTLPYDEFRLFTDTNGLAIHEDWHDDIIHIAEEFYDKDYPTLSATLYMRFSKDGNRVVFEEQYHLRRQMLRYFTLAEYIEGKGRFLDRIVDGIWFILEESSWVIPAHGRQLPDMKCPLPHDFDEVDNICLFAAETAANLALTMHLLGRKLDEISPIIVNRMRYEISRRITTPFLEHENWWWMGYYRSVNNWCPWITSNVLFIVSIVEQNHDIRRKIVEKSLILLNHFTSNYHEDGGCDEGPSYWTAAGVCYFDALDILYDMTGGALDVFHLPFIKNMMEFIVKVSICDDYFVNFADCGARLKVGNALLRRMGRRLHSDMLVQYSSPSSDYHPVRSELYHVERLMRTLCEPKSFSISHENCKRPTRSWFPGIGVMTARENENPKIGLFFAMKGGNNAESHNHNDLGNFIVYANGEPLIIDVGVGTYTAQTFSEDRYKIWTMQSCYHNLPSIGGYDQLFGKEYHADAVEYSEKQNRLSMSLMNAYPSEANIVSYTRSCELTSGSVVIKDSFRLSEASQIIFHAMTADEPHIADGETISLSNGRVLKYDGSLTASIERIELTDPAMQRGWNRTALYRISFAANAVTDQTFTMRIE